MIAALFVAADGPYIGLEGVDPWTAERDAFPRCNEARVPGAGQALPGLPG